MQSALIVTVFNKNTFYSTYSEGSIMYPKCSEIPNYQYLFKRFDILNLVTVKIFKLCYTKYTHNVIGRNVRVDAGYKGRKITMATYLDDRPTSSRHPAQPGNFIYLSPNDLNSINYV